MGEVPNPVPVSAGLIARGAAVPLEGVSVDAHITGVSARVTIAQRYRNNETEPIEAVYTFPLDEGAAVCGFEAISNGVHFVGEVLERDEAFKRYDDAMSAGHSAYLLDEERPDVFSASVGNVPPGAEVLIRLTYVTELTLEGDDIRFTLPITVSPRYAPAEDRQAVGRPDAEALNPPVAWRVPYGLDLAVRLDLAQPISRVQSPSHPVSIVLEGTKATVTLASERAALDRDFVLLAGPSGVDRPVVFLEAGEDGQEAALIAFRPTFDVDQVPAEVVFLVDRSGSMAGSSIEQVRNALHLCLRSLVSGCRFDIVGFGSTFESLFSESRSYDEASLAEASEAVGRLEADLGGTEILPALEFVLTRPSAGELPRQVFVLTDGEVTNTDAVIALARQHAAKARLFTFGIGRGASHHLVRGLARAGRGVAEFIYPGERIEAKVMRQFARLLSPCVTHVALDWGGLVVTQSPRAIPPVFAGERLIVYGLLDKARATTVTLSGTTSHGKVAWTARIDPSAAVSDRVIAPLAARTLIREMEEGPDWLEGRVRGSRQHPRKAEQIKQEIVRLAKKYGLASRETSFVAVEQRQTPIEGEAVLRRIPIALTSGWGASDDMERMAASAQLAPTPAAASHWLRAMPAQAPDVAFSRCSMESDASGPTDDSAFLDGELQPPTLASRSFESDIPVEEHVVEFQRISDRLIVLQRADGRWELSGEFAEIIGLPLGQIEAAMGQAAGDDEARAAWATALALAWLELHAGDARDEWRMLARKAERWLRGALGAPGLANELLASAQRLLEARQ